MQGMKSCSDKREQNYFLPVGKRASTLPCHHAQRPPSIAWPEPLNSGTSSNTPLTLPPYPFLIVGGNISNEGT